MIENQHSRPKSPWSRAFFGESLAGRNSANGWHGDPDCRVVNSQGSEKAGSLASSSDVRRNALSGNDFVSRRCTFASVSRKQALVGNEGCLSLSVFSLQGAESGVGATS